MKLNDVGKIADEEWLKTPKIRSSVELDDYVIMPNHVHGIIIINDISDATPSVGADSSPPLRTLHRIPHSLGSILAGFKSSATKQINVARQTPSAPVWQRSYYEHIIRNDADLHRIREYIANNPLRWALDKENPANVKKA